MPKESIVQDGSNPAASYDEVPYASHPYARSHPRNLAALGTLFGMSPPDVHRCRVLELGCAAGGNILPMAAAYPEASFLGIDASGHQINQGKQAVDALRLQNLDLRQLDLLELPGDVGTFDYVICHGVYSWVPAPVQQKILSICDKHLAPNGIAYVSYNTYPGWYLRRGVREMMNYHAEGFRETQTRIDQSRALLDFLSETVDANEHEPAADAYSQLLQDELQVLRSSEDSYLFHEHLEHYNEPLFFHQFADRAAEHQLKFLCEAHFSAMIPNGYSSETQATLSEIAPDIIQMEQYLDFLRNRKFRQTLLCHESVRLNRSVDASRVRDLEVASPLQPIDSDENDGSRSGFVFQHPSGQSLSVVAPAQAAALRLLGRLWPSDIPLVQLSEQVWGSLQSLSEDSPDLEAVIQQVSETVLACYSNDLVELNATAGPESSTRMHPRFVSALVRYQAQQGDRATNFRHQSVHLGETDRMVLQRLSAETPLESLKSIGDADEIQASFERLVGAALIREV